MCTPATTIISSKSHRIRISPTRRTVVIGERCNTLGYKKVRETILNGDWTELVRRAEMQFEAGARIINVNMVGLDLPEKTLLPMASKVIRSRVDAPLSFDFGDPDALAVALEKTEGRCLINSVSAEEEKMYSVFPLAKRYNAAMIAMLCNDDGIPTTPQARLACAHQILKRGAEFGFTVNDFIFDGVGLAIATDVSAGQTTLDTLQLIRDTLGGNCTLGVSNVSFGMPKRRLIEMHYMAMAIQRGMNAPLTDVMNKDLRWAIQTADAILGKDKLGIRFIRQSRCEKLPALEGERVAL